MRVGVLALVLFPTALVAQQTPTSPIDKCTIEGHVVKAATGEPLKRARITLGKTEGREPPLTATTDTAGRFVIKEIGPGRYRLSVERDGYVRQEYGQRGYHRAGTILRLEAGQYLRDITFRMLPAAAVSGRVFDEDGEPLAGVGVQALQYTYRQGRRQLTPVGGSPTNDLGEYRIWGLIPGRYFIVGIYSPGMGIVRRARTLTSEESGQEEAYAPAYYPGTNDPARATMLELRAGEEASKIDFGFIPVRTVRIRGRVLDSVPGQSGRGTVVVLMPREPGGRAFFFRNQAMVEDAQGNFELRGVIPGAYVLMANRVEEGKVYSARQPVDVGAGDVEGISLVIGPGTDIAGRIRVEDSSGFYLTDVRIVLQAQGEASIPSESRTAVKKDGTFTLQNVPEGVFSVGVDNAPEDYFVKSARVGAEDVLATGLAVGRGRPAGTLELTLSPTGGSVAGFVLGEEQLPASGALVALVPEPSRRTQTQWYKATATDQHGRFVLKGIAPGEYKLFAWEDIEPGAYQDPDFLRPFEDKGMTIRVEEGHQQAVELKLIPAETRAP